MTDESETSLNRCCDVLESIREIPRTAFSFSTQLKFCDKHSEHSGEKRLEIVVLFY